MNRVLAEVPWNAGGPFAACTDLELTSDAMLGCKPALKAVHRSERCGQTLHQAVLLNTYLVCIHRVMCSLRLRA